MHGLPFVYIVIASTVSHTLVYRLDVRHYTMSKVQRLPRADGVVMFEHYYDNKRALVLLLFGINNLMKVYYMPRDLPQKKFRRVENFSKEISYIYLMGKCERTTHDVICFCGSLGNNITVYRWHRNPLTQIDDIIKVNHSISELYNVLLGYGDASIDTTKYHGNMLVAMSEMKEKGYAGDYYEEHAVHIFTIQTDDQGIEASSVQTIEQNKQDVTMVKFVHHDQYLYLLVGLPVDHGTLVYKYNDQFRQFERTSEVLISATGGAYFSTHDGEDILVLVSSDISSTSNLQLSKSKSETYAIQRIRP